jgi:hypothetical protein
MMQAGPPNAIAAMTASGGISGQAAEALVGSQPGFSSNITQPVEAPAAAETQATTGGMA